MVFLHMSHGRWRDRSHGQQDKVSSPVLCRPARVRAAWTAALDCQSVQDEDTVWPSTGRAGPGPHQAASHTRIRRQLLSLRVSAHWHQTVSSAPSTLQILRARCSRLLLTLSNSRKPCTP